jgi:hypothetical protein
MDNDTFIDLNKYNCFYIPQYNNVDLSDNIRDDLYRLDLVNVFCCNNKLDDDFFPIMNNSIDYLNNQLSTYTHSFYKDDYLKIKKDIFNIITKSSNRMFSDDNILGISLLFSFDTFHIFHQLISLYFRKTQNNTESHKKFCKNIYLLIDKLNKILS